MIRKLATLALLAVAIAAPARADDITRWDFDSETTAPVIGTGTLTYSPVMGNENYFTGNPGRAWSISPLGSVVGQISATNPEPKTAWVQFTTGTDGWQGINVSWSQRVTSTGVSHIMFQYTTDGTTWVDHELLRSTAVAQWVNFSVDLSGIPAVDNNPNFAFRLAADISPDTGNYIGPGGANTATTGNWRLDNVLVSGNPYGVTGPSPTISAPSKENTILGPVVYEVNFDEPVTGFDSAWDVIVNATGSAWASTVTITGTDGTAGPYYVELSDIFGFGTISITIPGGAANAVVGGAASLASAPSQAFNVFTEPRATISRPSAYFLNTGGPLSYEVSFNLPVNGFAEPEDIQLDPLYGDFTVDSIVISGTDGTAGPYTVTMNGISGTGLFAFRVAGGAVEADGIGNLLSFRSDPVKVVSSANIVSAWSFDSNPPDFDVTTGVVTPSFGNGVITTESNITYTFATGFPNAGDLNDNSGWNLVPFAGIPQGAGDPPLSTTNPLPKSRYLQFAADTTNFTDIQISFEHRFSDTAVNTFVVQYTLDGFNWVDAMTFTAPAGSTWYQHVVDISDVAGANNNPNFAVRLAADVDPNTGEYAPARSASTLGTGGTWRVDNFRISGNGTAGPPVSIAEARNLPDGTLVQVCDAYLYLNGGSFGYISSADRANGIRIQGSIAPAAGSIVCVTGTMATTAGGEKYIAASGVSQTGIGAVTPVGANNKTLKTDLIGGIHVKAYGTVVPGSLSANSYILSDGSDENGIPVITIGAPTVTEGDFVTVTGAAGYDAGRVIYAE